MSQQTAGASILALGSAAPEITVNIVVTIKAATASASDGSDPAALGTAAIIGSGYIGFLVIPAICALASSKKLQLARRPLMRDIGFYTGEFSFLIEEGLLDFPRRSTVLESRRLVESTAVSTAADSSVQQRASWLQLLGARAPVSRY